MEEKKSEMSRIVEDIKNLKTEQEKLQKQISDLSISKNERIEKLKLMIKNLPKWVYGVWTVSIAALAFSSVAFFTDSGIMWNVEIVSATLIVAFMGVIATIIVINNHSQVIDIRNETRTELKKSNVIINELRDEFKTGIQKNSEKLQSIEKQMNMYINDINKKLRFIEATSSFGAGKYSESLLGFLSLLDYALNDIDSSQNGPNAVFINYIKSYHLIVWIENIKDKCGDKWSIILNEKKISEIIEKIKGKLKGNASYELLCGIFENVLDINGLKMDIASQNYE